MRTELERLLREVTLVTLAFAIALGWSLYQAVSGLAGFITTLLQRFSSSDLTSPFGDLSWTVGHHVLVFGPLLRGVIELAVVLCVILLVRRHAEAVSRAAE